jgi:hypothetical protein
VAPGLAASSQSGGQGRPPHYLAASQGFSTGAARKPVDFWL